MRNFTFCKVGCFSKMEENFENFFCPSFVLGQRCFEPKNHKDWPYHFGDIATIPSKPGLSLILHFWHFWYTLMTKKCSEGLDLIFFIYWSTKNFFVKIGALLVQKCLALPEYSQLVGIDVSCKLQRPHSNYCIYQQEMQWDLRSIIHYTDHRSIIQNCFDKICPIL